MEEQKVQGTPLGAFIVCGGITLAMQFVMVALGAILPAGAGPLVNILTMAILGIAGMVLVLTGIYAKLNEFGGFGASIVLSGLVDGVSGVYAEATLASGGKRSAGISASLKFLGIALGPLCLISVIVGFVLGKIGFLGVIATLSDTSSTPIPLVFIMAPLMGGVIGLVGQLLIQYAHIPMPFVTLIEGAAGMMMAAFGVLTKLEAVCGAGLACTVVDAGGGLVAGGALLALEGTPLRILIIAFVMALIALIGIATGMVLVKRAEQAPYIVPETN